MSEVLGSILVAIEKRIFRALALKPALCARELKSATGLNTGQLWLGIQSLEEVGAITRNDTGQIFSLTDAGREHYETFVGPEPAKPDRPAPPSLHQGILF